MKFKYYNNPLAPVVPDRINMEKYSFLSVYDRLIEK